MSGRLTRKTILLAIGALLTSAVVAKNVGGGDVGGGLRRKRTTDKKQNQHRRLTEASDGVDQELASRFFLPSKAQAELDEIDMRELLFQMNVEMNLDMSMSFVQTPAPTPLPTPSPTMSTEAPSVSTMPTLTDCNNPGTCENRLRDQIFAVSVRMGTTEALDDPNSPQSQARDWILEECDAEIPIDPCTASQLILNEQRYGLAVMYFGLGGDSWNVGANPGQDKAVGSGQWMSGLNYCEWGAEITGTGGSYFQLVCDDSGNVLNLNLQSNNMVGQIPPEIGVFFAMTSYISFFNAQTGALPTTLGYILPLETFDVESNNLEGPLFQPEYAGPDGLKEIKNFRASLNNFVGTIPAEIGQWTKTENLWFADNQITGTIPSEIGSLVEMGAFLFYKNKISGTIPPEMGNLNKLTWIDCEDNQIVGTLPEEFFSNVELEEVILKTNSISGSISSTVGDLNKLNTFWVSFNQISGTIPSTFGNLANLQELELQSNRLTGTIPTEFGTMEAIDFISVESNMLTGNIPSELFGTNLAGLRILYLNDNQLSGTIPDNYGSSPRLKDLWLSDNLLTGTLPIISEGEFLFLEELLINNNDITGVVDESVCLVRNNTIPGGQLGVFHADCQPPPNGGEPQIQCSCCTACFV
eukprot:CAMPEP_0201737828 /NCGR_PEP_ID=MMETSP0593-20130828/43408_1 /ASSEMBLY_ACC=CAM_ASM_000672 /TAXON_ID=267983 /ORGANISM="Skeletonema japonicum, Strain CCMP2506" /LENGTH=639 /DNA_ID=CAMNT_0048231889 /DNA_START=12 /DNA_END=1931 /DNA_ORIENTATION=+